MNLTKEQLRAGLETAYIDGFAAVNSLYKPSFVSNNPYRGKKVLSTVEEELLRCERFDISVAFITLSGVTPLLQTLKELENKNIPGRILTTNYLTFSEPEALRRLNELKNITVKMFDAENGSGFHTKGYIFKKEEVYRIIIGSSNMTASALTTNYEWNTKLVSTEHGEVAQEIVAEFEQLWNNEHSYEYESFADVYRERYQIIKRQRAIAKQDVIPSLEKYTLKPNSMQEKFVANLRKIIESGADRALLISATGTGKTIASAFGMRELGFQRVLFLVHRKRLAEQTEQAYKKVFSNKVTTGIVQGRDSLEEHKDKRFLFAMVQTLSRDENLTAFRPDEFDAIVLDETHHGTAASYQKIMRYFKPRFWLGMTATPDKEDDNIEGKNVYELFNYNIAQEIRLQQAMEDNLLCPFHYFGITDLSMIDDQGDEERTFSELTSDERVKHLVSQAYYYGYSGDRVKGLIFCSRKEECEVLSKKMNRTVNPETGRFYRTITLSSNTPEYIRAKAFDRLAMDEGENYEEPLDYIFSVDLLNEGIDIIEVNQVIMLRPTKSPIVFIQQLGRGLRKAEGKEYVVVLDFIGNYNNNYMIPIALSGDRTYNKDTIRKYVISGNNCIPGASTVHFDAIAKEKIFASIDKIKGMKAIIRNSYKDLKERLGRIPLFKDFYEYGEVDPLVIVREYKTYQNLLSSVEKPENVAKISESEMTILEYLSKTVLSGIRPYELEMLRKLLDDEVVEFNRFQKEFSEKYGYEIDLSSYDNAVDVLKGKFVSKDEEYTKYCSMDIFQNDRFRMLRRLATFTEKIRHYDFYEQINDIVEVGLRRFQDKYKTGITKGSPFVLDEKYSRRDVCLLMNCGRDYSSTMYGMKRIGEDTFIFVTYHKAEASDDREYVEGKPDYADAFENNVIFRWDSQIGKGVDSSYVADVLNAKRRHLFVKKSDAETNFYYMGQFDVTDVKASQKKDNSGKEKDIAKFEMRMHNAVRDDLLKYLQSDISTVEANVITTA